MNEERLEAEGRAMRACAAAVADTDAAWRTLQQRRPRGAWIATAAAAALVIAVLASTVFVRSGSPEGVAAPTPTTAAVAQPTVAETTEPTPTLPPATTIGTTVQTSPPPTDNGTFPPERHCTYTDPARRAITVARALSCPDGTFVWVTGIVVTNDEGSFLCHDVSGTAGDACEGPGLELVGLDRAVGRDFTGIKQGDELHLQSPVGPPVTNVQTHKVP